MLQSTQKYSGFRASTSVEHLDGRWLSYKLRGKTPTVRAKIAAACGARGVVIYTPTDKQLAACFGVSVYRLAQARNGKKKRNGQNGHAETLAQHMERSTLAEWQQAARIYGVDRLWDQMISPVISEERAAANSTA